MNRRLPVFAAAALAVGGVFALLLSVSPAHPAAGNIRIPQSVLARASAGDLVFRTGTETVSQAVRLLDDGHDYSHVGMLVGGPGHWQIIHAVPAEPPRHEDAVVIDDLDYFEAPAHARAVALFHVQATPEQRRKATGWIRRQLGRPFGFEAPRTYCTKLVWQAWRQAGVDLHVRFSRLHLPLLPGPFLMPSELAASSRLQPVWRGPSTPRGPGAAD